MQNLLTYRRIKQLLNWLEENDGILTIKQLEPFQAQFRERYYRRAISILEASHCIKITRAWGGELFQITLLPGYALHQLERHDIWMNRIYGFISGVLVTVVANFIMKL